MSRGAEAYLQTWERAQGVKADSCRNPDLRRATSTWQRSVTRGMTSTQLIKALGQPYTRLGTTYTFRSEEHTSELQSLMRISYAVFCLKKKKKKITTTKTVPHTIQKQSTMKQAQN